MASTKKKNPPQLNKFMHPRNPYKKSPPSFKELATLYPEFRTHCTYDITGKVFLDFKNPDALRALTVCLLDKDFGLKVIFFTDWEKYYLRNQKIFINFIFYLFLSFVYELLEFYSLKCV